MIVKIVQINLYKKFYGTYWKGWLENKEVWLDFKDSFKLELNTIYHSKLAEKYDQAINGKTKLEPYDNG